MNHRAEITRRRDENTMDPQSVAQIISSFDAILPSAASLPDLFFARLFTENPGLRPLYPINMDQHKRELRESLISALRRLRLDGRIDPDTVNFGGEINARDYAIIRDTLIATMREIAADRWDVALDRSWKVLLDRAVSRSAPAYPPA